MSSKDKEQYTNLRKVTIGHWGYFNYCLCFVLLYPNILRSTEMKKLGKTTFILSVFLSLAISRYTNKYICKYFSPEEYNEFRIFCLKRDIKDILI